MTDAPLQAGGLGTVHNFGPDYTSVMLDNDTFVRVTNVDQQRLGVFGKERVAIAQLETRDSALWAVGVELTDLPFQAPHQDLPPAPERKPVVEDPAAVEQRRKEAAERFEHNRKRHMAARSAWLEQHADKPAVDEGEWRELISEALSPDLVESLMTKVKPAERLVAIGDGAMPHDASRFGGLPALPEGVDWPEREGRPLAFLAQLDRDDLGLDDDKVASLGLEGLPQGRLLFFYDAEEQPWGFEPEDASAKVVVHVSPGAASSVREPPDGLSAESVFPACRVRAVPTTTLPSPFSQSLPPAVRDNDALYGAWWDVHAGAEGSTPALPRHQIGGWPDVIQDDMELACQLVSQGVRMGNQSEYDATFKAELEAGAEEWVLLLQLDSDDEGPGWMWGDLGRLYWWIRRQDLAKGDFSQMWLVLQCT